MYHDSDATAFTPVFAPQISYPMAYGEIFHSLLPYIATNLQSGNAPKTRRWRQRIRLNSKHNMRPELKNVFAPGQFPFFQLINNAKELLTTLTSCKKAHNYWCNLMLDYLPHHTGWIKLGTADMVIRTGDSWHIVTVITGKYSQQVGRIHIDRALRNAIGVMRFMRQLGYEVTLPKITWIWLDRDGCNPPTTKRQIYKEHDLEAFMADKFGLTLADALNAPAV